jgi:ferredoxin
MTQKSILEYQTFILDSECDNNSDFRLESPVFIDDADTPTIKQSELFLAVGNPEDPEKEDQLELVGIEKPCHAIHVEGISKPLEFHFASNLLESLEAQDVQIPYQCREGYCGGCRTDLIEGQVAYLQEPLAWVNEGEILPCCCVPKTAIKLRLKG